MNDQNQQLTTYIQQSLAQGTPISTIRNQLVQYGWPEQVVDEALRPFSSQPLLSPVVPTINQPVTQKHQKRLLWTIGGLLLALFIIVLVVILVHGRAAAPANEVTDNAGLSELQLNAINTQRKNDVSILLAGVGEYISNHGGELPSQTATGKDAHELDICGASCDDSDKSIVKLSYYQNTPTAISFHAYASGLKVPDANTVYIVANAGCNGNSLTSNQARSAAIVYAATENGSSAGRCETL